MKPCETVVHNGKTYILIAQDYLDELYDASRKLYYLEVGGVDNWEWYDTSLEPYRAELHEECDTWNEDDLGTFKDSDTGPDDSE